MKLDEWERRARAYLEAIDKMRSDPKYDWDELRDAREEFEAAASAPTVLRLIGWLRSIRQHWDHRFGCTCAGCKAIDAMGGDL